VKIEVISKRDFGNVGIQLIQAEGDDETFWLSGEEVGKALELDEPKKAIHKIYQRHKDELEEFSMLWIVDTPGGPQETRIFSEEAVYMITFFSQSKKAKEFRQWVARLLKAYRQGKLGMGMAAKERLARMKEQRLFMKEQRRFQETAKAEAERIIQHGGNFHDLDEASLLQEAVKVIVKNDPRSKQLGLFD
jgi:prophage antirepressor-like protein